MKVIVDQVVIGVCDKSANFHFPFVGLKGKHLPDRDIFDPLQKLVAVLRERNVNTQLDLDIKDPSEFTCEYVLQIINKIGEIRDSAAKTRSCKNFVRRCYQKVEDNRSAIDGFLTMIPSDVYGSVISGGYAMIMAVRLEAVVWAMTYVLLQAVEKRAQHREAIQNFLAEIPERLETIQRLSQIHHASVRLHLRADAVIVTVFTVLERIVDEITKVRKSKRLISPTSA